MEYKRIIEILDKEGYNKKLSYNDKEIREIESFPGGESYFLSKEKDTWKIGYITMERARKEEIIEIYTSLRDASHAFLLNRLSSYYLNKYISQAEENTQLIELMTNEKLTIEELSVALKKCNISDSYLSTEKIKNHSIRIKLENEGWISEYIDINGISHGKMNPTSLSECNAFTFTRIMYLYLIDMVTRKYFRNRKSYDYFTTKEIIDFIT